VDRFEMVADLIGALRPDEVTIGVQRALESVVRGQARVLVVDYAQTCLVELVGTSASDRESFAVEATVAGRAYTTGQHQEVADEAGCRLWLPLLQGAHRVGVLEVQTLTPLTPEQRSSIDTIAAVLVAVLSAGTMLSDALPVTRRLLPMELAAEIVWGLLPPLTFVNSDVSVAGILEPCYDVGGDAFDALEHVRAVEHDPAFRRQCLHQAPEHERRCHVEAGVGLVEDDDRRIVQERGGDQDLLPHALRIRRHRGMDVVPQAE